MQKHHLSVMHQHYDITHAFILLCITTFAHAKHAFELIHRVSHRRNTQKYQIEKKMECKLKRPKVRLIG